MLKKRTPLWREVYVEFNMHKTHHVQSTFGSWDVQKVQAVVAGSRLRSQKCKKHQKTDICKTHHVRSTLGRSTAPHYTTLQIRYNTTATTTAATTPLYYTHSTSPHFSTLRHHYNYNYNCNYNYDYNGYYSYSYNYNITTTTTSTTATTIQCNCNCSCSYK